MNRNMRTCLLYTSLFSGGTHRRGHPLSHLCRWVFLQYGSDFGGYAGRGRSRAHAAGGDVRGPAKR